MIFRFPPAVVIAGLLMLGGCVSTQERQDADTITHATATVIRQVTIYKTQFVKAKQTADLEKENLKLQVADLQKKIADLKFPIAPSPANFPWIPLVATAFISGAVGYGIGRNKK